jgi:hypothetical protein
MSNDDAVEKFIAFSRHEKDGRVVLTRAQSVARDVLAAIDASSKALRDQFEDNDDLQQFLVITENVVAVLEPALESSTAPLVDNVTCHLRSRQLVRTARDVLNAYETFADAFTEDEPAIKALLREAFQKAAHDVLGLSHSNQIVGPHNLMELSMERHMPPPKSIHTTSNFISSEAAIKIFDDFECATSFSFDGSQTVFQCARYIVSDTLRLIANASDDLESFHKDNIRKEGLEKTFDHINGLAGKLLDDTRLVGSIRTQNLTEIREACKHQVRRATEIFDDYRKCAIQIAAQCPEAGRRLNDILLERGHQVLELKGHNQALKPENLMSQVISRRVWAHTSSPPRPHMN